MKNNIPPLICFDTETGGKKSNECAITQMCFQLIDTENWETIEVVKEYVKPHYNPNLKYEDEALEKTGISIEMMENEGIPIKELGEKVYKFLQKALENKTRFCGVLFAGHNVAFDIGFFQQLMEESGLKKDFEKLLHCKKDYYGNAIFNTIDTLELSKLRWPKSEGFSLTECCKKSGIEVFDMHDAGNDVYHTAKLLEKYIGDMKGFDEGEGESKKENKKRTFQFA